MNILKRIQILLLILSPACLLGTNTEQKNSWIAEALSCPHVGAWIVQDKSGKTVIVEGELISKGSNIISSGAYLNVLSNMADVMQEQFDNTYLEVWLFIKIRSICQRKSYRDILYGRYIDMINDVLAPENNDLCYIFTASEQQADNKKVLLGSAIFDIEKDYEYGTVELDDIGVNKESRGRNISKILASAIFKILPQTKRVTLGAVCTNIRAISAYESFGFTKYENKYEELNMFSRIMQSYCFNYEYLTDKCQKLQTVAATFKEIKN